MKIYIKNVGDSFYIENEEEQIGWTTNSGEIYEIIDDFLDENDMEEIVDVVHM